MVVPSPRQRRCPKWNLRGLAAIMAVRWTSYGNPSEREVSRVLADFWCTSPEEAEEQWWKSASEPFRGGQALYEFVSDAYHLVRDHTLLPPLREDRLRANHNFGLKAETPEEKEQLLDAILTEGLRPQPAGKGKWSEAPHLVFAIADFPPGETVEDRRYNRHYPWVVIETLRKAIDPETGYPFVDIEPTRPGGVAAFFNVHPSFIVAVNGYPVQSFIRMRQMLLGR